MTANAPSPAAISATVDGSGVTVVGVRLTSSKSQNDGSCLNWNRNSDDVDVAVTLNVCRAYPVPGPSILDKSDCPPNSAWNELGEPPDTFLNQKLKEYCVPIVVETDCVRTHGLPILPEKSPKDPECDAPPSTPVKPQLEMVQPVRLPVSKSPFTTCAGSDAEALQKSARSVAVRNSLIGQFLEGRKNVRCNRAHFRCCTCRKCQKYSYRR